MKRAGIFLLLCWVAGSCGANVLLPGPYFVLGSWVNVRAAAATDSAVIAHVTTNTAVTLRQQVGATCAVTLASGQAGFLPCRLLGTQALTLADIAPTLSDGSDNPGYSPLRQFWLAPSMQALFYAGRYFQDTLLSPAQTMLEQGYAAQGQLTRPDEENTEKPVHLVRYPVPEFEAMKALLAAGTVVPYTDDWQPCQMPAAKQDERRAGYLVGKDCRMPGLPGLSLPKIRASFFRSKRGLTNTAGSVDALSATFGIPESGQVLAGPRWLLDYDTWRYAGAWDVGKYRVTLARPVVEEVVGRSGLVGAYAWTPQQEVIPLFVDERAMCDETARWGRLGKQRLPDYPAVKDALLVFEVPAALPFRHVHVASKVLRAPLRSKQFDTVMDEVYLGKVAAYEVDLDGDGVPDMVEWDIFGADREGRIDGTQYARDTFANIAGQWFMLDYAAVAECI